MQDKAGRHAWRVNCNVSPSIGKVLPAPKATFTGGHTIQLRIKLSQLAGAILGTRKSSRCKDRFDVEKAIDRHVKRGEK